MMDYLFDWFFFHILVRIVDNIGMKPIIVRETFTRGVRLEKLTDFELLCPYG